MATKAHRERKKLILVLGILLCIGGGFTLYTAWPLLGGETVILATLPVDPFDPVRGQYMTIAYEISRLPDGEYPHVVYVKLRVDEEGIARFASVHSKKPNGLFIRGEVRNNRAYYGIEQFFFERNAHVPRQNITVEVRIDGAGNAQLVQLLQNREPIQITYERPTLTS